MVTGNEEILWSYLLDPCFQLINTAGKPLTNGYIEVYYAGTRNKYYCASDFSGTLHPFKIPIDSLGSNIVLADPAFRYDIYVYNQFGSLQMSRYNVSPVGTAGSSQDGNVNADHWIGTYGSSQNIPGDNVTIEPMPLPSSPDYQGSFIDRIVGNIMYLKPGTYLVDCIIRYRQNPEDTRNIYGEVLVYTGTENGLESGSWIKDETGVDADDDLNHFLRVSFIRDVTDDKHNDSLYFRPQTPVNWQYAYIKKLSIVKLGSGASIGGRYQGGDYISIEGNTISVTGINPEEYLTSGDLEGYATHDWTSAYVESVVTGLAPNYQAGEYISIDGDTISVTGIHPEDYLTSGDLDGYATESWTSAFVESYVTGHGSIDMVYHDDHFLGMGTSADPLRLDSPIHFESNISSGSFGPNGMVFTDGDHDHTAVTSEGISLKQGEYTAHIDAEDVQRWNASSGGREYSAGQYISIENDTISATGLQPAGNYLTSGDLEGYATEQYVNDATSAFITSADLPSLDGYATEQFVENYTSGFITSADLPDLSDYATKDYVEDATSAFITSADLPSLDGYATEQYVDDSIDAATSGLQPAGDYLTSADLNGYATENWTNSQITAAVSGKADKGEIPSLDGYATQNWVEDYSSGFITSADIPSLDGYATETYVQNYTSAFASESDVQTLIDQSTSAFITSADVPSLEGYATQSWVENYSSGFVTSADIPEPTSYTAGDNISIDNDVISVTGTKPLVAGNNISIYESASAFIITAQGGSSPYSAGQYIKIENDVISVTGLQPSGSYLTSADLNGYATESYVDSEVSGKADKSEIPSLDGYATEQYVEDATSAFITSADVPSLAGYATESWVENFTSGFITSADVPSLAGYATETYVQNYTSGFISDSEAQTLIDQSTSAFITSADLPSLEGYATESWVENYSSGFITSADLPDLSDYATKQYVGDATSAFITSAALNGYATESWVGEQGFASNDEVNFAIGDYNDYVVQPALSSKLDTSAYVAPVQSDWSQTTSGALDYIKNKPAKSQLLAGTNITIAPSGNDFVISSTGGGGGGGTSYSAGQYISLANDTISVTGLAPQVQADWSQSASGNVDYIKNKPVTLPLIAGDGISITVTASGIVISATGGGGSTGGLDLKFGPLSGSGTIALYNFNGITWSSGKVLNQSSGTERSMTTGELAFFNSSTDPYNGIWLGSGGYIVLHTDDTSILVTGYGNIQAQKSNNCTLSGFISVSLKKDGTEIATDSTVSFDYSSVTVQYYNQ